MKRPYVYESITTLNISGKNLTELPSWINECKKLKKLHCNDNQITLLNNLPQTLEYLDCSNNQITQLDNLPELLDQLKCPGNQITQLDNLPEKVNYVLCIQNPLKYEFEPTIKNIRNYINEINY